MNARFLLLLLAITASPPAMAADCLHPTPLHVVTRGHIEVRTGGVLRAEDACYVLSARAGQRLFVSVLSPDDNVVAAVYRPGFRVTPATDGPDIKGRTLPGASDTDDARAVRALLPTTGQYLLVLGTMRGAGGQYRLRVGLR